MDIFHLQEKLYKSGLGKAFDYGCKQNKFEVYIYRITYTNPNGDVFEFTSKQVQDWSKERNLKAVPELYYGEFEKIFPVNEFYETTELSFEEKILKYLRDTYLEKDCYMCKNKLPAEGIVVRKEDIKLEAYKYKSFKFLDMETKQLDKNEEDIEESN